MSVNIKIDNVLIKKSYSVVLRVWYFWWSFHEQTNKQIKGVCLSVFLRPHKSWYDLSLVKQINTEAETHKQFHLIPKEDTHKKGFLVVGPLKSGYTPPRPPSTLELSGLWGFGHFWTDRKNCFFSWWCRGYTPPPLLVVRPLNKNFFMCVFPKSLNQVFLVFFYPVFSTFDVCMYSTIDYADFFWLIRPVAV